jgi:hypothetical protein
MTLQPKGRMIVVESPEASERKGGCVSEDTALGIRRRGTLQGVLRHKAKRQEP